MTAPGQRPKFWLVWNPAGRNPSYRHHVRSAAESEAERLARLNPGQIFVVLEALCAKRALPVETIALTDSSDDFPF